MRGAASGVGALPELTRDDRRVRIRNNRGILTATDDAHTEIRRILDDAGECA